MDEHDQPDQGPGEGQERNDASTAEDTTTVERRRSPRLPVRLEATCRRLGHDDGHLATTTVDVSHGGARIVASAGMAVGDVVQLMVPMPDGIELSLQGLVVQISNTPGSHAHLAFDSLSTTAADLLIGLAADSTQHATEPAPDPEG